ncbi:uncharacterized protein I303_101422 [Kwoniella dejecticola CBS 10117]|uniref:Zn(2)-C6 fungal-type domain-containing protein n=1 Tax=Kwoniella dejecticola CBS 10117 TaxID=1296121 RepID=A0A1A6AHP9_9TREE|nr:uncharacterized protein I303_01431 [Kwoniella dejecticola CBS 10117]OBR89602.1 hypothetical protein I303_01431 [Kwoniella dejecticola CBS 10117]
MIRNRPPSPASSSDHPEGGRTRIKRSRAVLVCSRCKSLKTRCDLGRPCSACVKAKVEDKCVYDHWRGQASNGSDPTPVNQSTNAGPGPATIESRMARIEQSLSRIDSIFTQNHPSPGQLQISTERNARNSQEQGDWPYLLSQLPPRPMLERLIQQYFILDTLTRYTHAPSFLRRISSLYSGQSNQIHPDLPKEEAPFLASLCLAMVIGSNISEDQDESQDLHEDPLSIARLIRLHQHFSTISTQIVINHLPSNDPAIAYYHLHSLMLRVQKSLLDSGSSLPETWFKMGEVFAVALYLRFHQDPDELPLELTPFWREMRRRLWYILYAGEKIATSKLRLPPILPLSNVRRPALIPDDDLREDITKAQVDDRIFVSEFIQYSGTTIADLTPPGITSMISGEKAAFVEWTFVDTKIGTTQLLSELSNLLSSSGPGPGPGSAINVRPVDISLVDNIVDQFDGKLPAWSKFDVLAQAQTYNSPLTAPDQPPWICAQACVQNIGIATAILGAYQPYLCQSTTTSQVDNYQQQTLQHALDKSLEAAHRLIVTAEIFIWHITFRWPEGKCLFTWNLGSRLFSAGALVAFAALRDGKDHPSWRGRMNDLKAAEGLMKVLSDHTRSKEKGKGENADSRALKILRQLSDRAKNSSGPPAHHYLTQNPANDNSTDRIYDPYTSHEMRSINMSSTTSAETSPGASDQFTLEDLEALLTQVYGKPV